MVASAVKCPAVSSLRGRNAFHREVAVPLLQGSAGGLYRSCVGEPLKRNVGFLLVTSKMNLFKRRWPWILLGALVVIAMLGILAVRALDELDKRITRQLMESKLVRTTWGTVLRRETFQCHEPTCVYIGYGVRTEINSGTSQKRIYFEIDNFNQLDEDRRAKAVQREKELVRLYGPRSTYGVDWYEQVKQGDKLLVRYQCLTSDGQIEIVGIEPQR